jgi:hypothetical protein
VDYIEVIKRKMKFDYGDAVIFSEIGTGSNLNERTCTVVAITPVGTEDQVAFFGYPSGTVLYTVEFGDGSDKLVPEDALEHVR